MATTIAAVWMTTEYLPWAEGGYRSAEQWAQSEGQDADRPWQANIQDATGRSLLGECYATRAEALEASSQVAAQLNADGDAPADWEEGR